MILGSEKAILRAAGIAIVCLFGSSVSNGQTGAEQKPLTAEKFFKNVKVLTGLPVNDFMTTMGFFSASLGYSCENCHGEDSGADNFAAEDRPKKQMARRMIAMVGNINKAYFGGQQVVTCYSCHRGSSEPKITPNLAALYSPPPEDPGDIVQQAKGGSSLDQILDKYIQAVGGAERLAKLTSIVAKGTSVGYGLVAEKEPLELYAKAPDERTTIVHTAAGDNTTTCDGHVGWMAGPQIAGPDIHVPVLLLTGGDLEGLKLDAELLFPGQIKQVLSQWRVGFQTEIDDHEVQVVQGSSADGAFATLYFDAESGLLVRMMRYRTSTVGRFPTQIDFSDYREVAGVKMPFKWTQVWLDGRVTIELTDVQANVPIAAAKFAKPPAK